MQYSEAKPGRIFVIRLEDGDVLHEQIERFARDQSIRSAALILVGAANEGSKLVVGPRRPDQSPITTMVHSLVGVHEIAGTGTIFWDHETGGPTAHIHIACGRDAATITGCVRRGVEAWQTIEIVLFELIDSPATRILDPTLGFQVLKP